jgi:hypothetical protein
MPHLRSDPHHHHDRDASDPSQTEAAALGIEAGQAPLQTLQMRCTEGSLLPRETPPDLPNAVPWRDRDQPQQQHILLGYILTATINKLYPWKGMASLRSTKI